MAFYSGTTGFFKVGSSSWKIDNWKLKINAEIVDTTGFGDSGYKTNIAGLKSATVSGSGPYDVGAMAMTAGTSYSLTLGQDTGVEFTITARISSIGVTNDVKDMGRVEFEAESTGSFTGAIT